ncbi:hypothetical protein EI94DRAFT_1268490 [Lactarius quietus]|nr:hypothetical protein EI94DRAFT_1268490 [Lactarius quietus]
MPSPSLPRRDFDFGSLSDSGVTSRIPPRRFNLSSPLPPLSLLHARHHSPSSPNLPIAGYFSDGDRSSNLLHPSRLDVKRLLSKPAAPSVNSTLSITSDSEPNALPRAQRSNAAWPSKTRMQVHFQPSSTPPRSQRSQFQPRRNHQYSSDHGTFFENGQPQSRTAPPCRPRFQERRQRHPHCNPQSALPPLRCVVSSPPLHCSL